MKPDGFLSGGFVDPPYGLASALTGLSLVRNNRMDIPEPRHCVRLRIASYGKASKSGPNVHKFARGYSTQELLARRGWQFVRQGREYVYLKSPKGQAIRKEFEIDITIPTEEEVLAVAEECHRRGDHWVQRIGEWVARYYPARDCSTQEIDPFTGAVGPTLVRPGAIPARFDVGEYGFWSAWVEWKDEGARGEYGENSTRLVHARPPAQLTLIADESAEPLASDDGKVDRTPSTSSHDIAETGLFEGAMRLTQTNRYERNRKARDACVRHFGARCTVCSLDFGETYGPEARGCIQVHHLVPISEIHQKYEVDPVRDLVPVCANCHAVIHSHEPPNTVSRVQELLRKFGPRAEKGHANAQRSCV